MIRLLFGELGDSLLLGSQRVLPRRLLDAGFEFQFGEAASALKDLLAY
jgi:NAD dependent epimerase/dehydratase family enzyme